MIRIRNRRSRATDATIDRGTGYLSTDFHFDCTCWGKPRLCTTTQAVRQILHTIATIMKDVEWRRKGPQKTGPVDRKAVPRNRLPQTSPALARVTLVTSEIYGQCRGRDSME